MDYCNAPSVYCRRRIRNVLVTVTVTVTSAGFAKCCFSWETTHIVYLYPFPQCSVVNGLQLRLGPYASFVSFQSALKVCLEDMFGIAYCPFVFFYPASLPKWLPYLVVGYVFYGLFKVALQCTAFHKSAAVIWLHNVGSVGWPYSLMGARMNFLRGQSLPLPLLLIFLSLSFSSASPSCFPAARLGQLCKLPSGVWARSPAVNAFRFILSLSPWNMSGGNDFGFFVETKVFRLKWI